MPWKILRAVRAGAFVFVRIRLFGILFAGGDPLGAQARLFLGSLCLLRLFDLKRCGDLSIVGGAQVYYLIEAGDSRLGAR